MQIQVGLTHTWTGQSNGHWLHCPEVTGLRGRTWTPRSCSHESRSVELPQTLWKKAGEPIFKVLSSKKDGLQGGIFTLGAEAKGSPVHRQEAAPGLVLELRGKLGEAGAGGTEDHAQALPSFSTPKPTQSGGQGSPSE